MGKITILRVLSKNNLFRSGWLVNSDTGIKDLYLRVSGLFSNILRRVSLRNPGYRKKFQRYLEHSELLNSAKFNLYPDENSEITKVYFLQLNKFWPIPWELTFNGLTNSRCSNISFIRVRDLDNLRQTPAVFPDKLKILILEGSNGSKGTAILRLEEETKTILDAIAALPYAVRASIDQPSVEKLSSGTLQQVLEKYQPNIIWYNGHGGNTSDDTVLLDINNEYLSASAFAKVLNGLSFKPLYIILSACDTASAPVNIRSNYTSPAFFEGLGASFPITLIAMQSPIRASSGAFLAREIIMSLREWNSLEISFADIRASHKTECLQANTTMHEADWAAPTIWTNREPQPLLEWNATLSKLEELQLLSLSSILNKKESLVTHSVLYEDKTPPHHAALLQEAIRESRFQFIIPDKSKELINTIYNFINRIIIYHDKAPLALDLLSYIESGDLIPPSEGQLVEGIRSWARFFIKRLGSAPPGANSELWRALKAIENSGNIPRLWKEICSINNLFLIIINPPSVQDPNTKWFWDPISGTKGNQIWIISNENVDTMMSEQWKIDHIDHNAVQASAQQALGDEPRLVKTLALLDYEFSYAQVKQTTLYNNENFTLQPYWNILFHNTTRGYLINWSAKRLIMDNILTTELGDVHSACADILEKKLIGEYYGFNAKIWGKLFYHYQRADNQGRAIITGTDLIEYYRREKQPVRLIEVGSRLNFTRLKAPALLLIAWAYVETADLQQAKFYLDRIDDDSINVNALDKASKYLLLAEIVKSSDSGNIADKAMAELDKGRQFLESIINGNDAAKAARARNLRLQFDHDKLRIIQYLYYDLDKAIEGYKTLLSNWSDENNVEGLNKAVVLRNLAECIRKKTTAQNNAPGTREIRTGLLESQSYIDSCIELCAKDMNRSVFYVDGLYERAKLYINRDELEPGNQNFLREAKDSMTKAMAIAAEEGYLMRLYILQAKYFTLFEDFQPEKCKTLINDLDGYSHGWAVRTQLGLLDKLADFYVVSNPDPQMAKELNQRIFDIAGKYKFVGYGESDKVVLARAHARNNDQ